MGQKVNPIGFRVGVYRDWDAQWFPRSSVKGAYGKELYDDLIIRKYLETNLTKAEIARIEIKKTAGMIKVTIHSAQPGRVIGKRGQEIDVLRKSLASMLKVNSVDISVEEIKTPELDAVLVAKNIATQLEQRANFKKLMKKAAASALKAGARGIKICVKGRLNGAEIARAEWTRIGSVPLHTLRADIQYGYARAHTVMGIIGVRVWICVGEYQTK
ncbi:30S ribosomal protein S3 [Candidatus Dependentiae bacterium]|nr:30S ribosomal protein S3 [Candidatus Dependentiae bacterium]